VKKNFLLILNLVLLLATTPLYSSDNQTHRNGNAITTPEYCGNVYGGFTWLWLKSRPTDGDLQAGTFLTLSLPPNLSAQLLQLESKPSSAYRLNLGYNFPCTNYNVDLAYFHYKGKDSSAINNIHTPEQFFQSFLGGAYSTFDASQVQRIHQANACFGKQFIVDDRLALQPNVGLGYANVIRNMNVNYTGLIDAPQVTESLLTGVEKSKYWGIGPTVGSDFSLSVYKCMSLEGTFGAGVLFGKIKSRIDALEKNVEDNVTNTHTFNAAENKFRAMPLINSQVALALQSTLPYACLDCQLKVGYELDYYFNVIDRINPNLGFVVNQNAFPVKQKSHLGLGGPFIKLEVTSSDDCYYNYCPEYCASSCNAIYGEVISSWLKPVSNNGDLIYAVLNTADGSKINQKAHFNHTWNGTYKLGYHTKHDYDFQASYFRLKDHSNTSITANNGQTISSVNASGNAEVVYSAAQSRVKYSINQGEFLVGKILWPECNYAMLISAGARYTQLKRTLQNEYTGGTPPTDFETKSNTLRSNLYGAGPIFTVQPSITLCNNLELEGYFATSLLAGKLRSKLDQVNMGTVSESSNTLRTPKTRWLTPVVDARAGLNYTICLPGDSQLKIEAGYQFAEYFKAINLVFPVFLTGLEQTNSDLKLHGPYLGVNFGIQF
jgi:Legionella pneumophila major outer membrane protein precursor